MDLSMTNTDVVLSRARESAVPAIFASQAWAEQRVLEFFACQINNDGTRKVYLFAARHFSAWCQSRNMSDLRGVSPIHMAAYLKTLEQEGLAAPTIKVRLTAL